MTALVEAAGKYQAGDDNSVNMGNNSTYQRFGENSSMTVNHNHNHFNMDNERACRSKYMENFNMCIRNNGKTDICSNTWQMLTQECINSRQPIMGSNTNNNNQIVVGSNNMVIGGVP